MKRVFQPQYSCGLPLSRELTREKPERLSIAVAPSLAEDFFADFLSSLFLDRVVLIRLKSPEYDPCAEDDAQKANQVPVQQRSNLC